MCMTQVQTWVQQQAERIQAVLSALEAERKEVQHLLNWISSAKESLKLRDQEPLPDSIEQTAELITQHAVRILTDTNSPSLQIDSCCNKPDECNSMHVFVGFYG